MHRSTWRTSAAPAALLLAAACGLSIDLDGAAVRGSGVAATDERTLADFDRIEVGGSLLVDVHVGGAPRVVLTGDDNLLPLVRTDVRGGTLHVEPKERIRPTERIRIEVTARALDGLGVSGSSTVTASGVRSAAFHAAVSGSGELTADGTFGDLTCSVSGSGGLALRGPARTVDASVSGSGELDLLEVPARAAEVTVSGSGDVGVHATERLDARISGSGDVRYRGEPAVQSSISGSGTVRRVS